MFQKFLFLLCFFMLHSLLSAQDQSQSEEETLYKRIISKDHTKQKEKTQLLARQFLAQYPDSSLRYEVIAILKKFVPKNMQLYTIQRTVFPSSMPPAIFFIASGIQEARLSLWKTDLIKGLKHEEDIYFLKTQSHSTLLRQWTEKSTKENHITKKLEIERLPPGCYIILAEEEDTRTEIGFFVSDLAMMVKHTEKSSLAWVSPRDGKRLQENVSLYVIEEQKKIYEGKVNEDGVWTGSFPKDSASLIFLASGERGDTMVAHPTWYHYEREQHKIYFLLNQPRFVSGDEVMAKIFLRSYSQEQYAFSHGSVFVSLQDSSWNMLLQKEVTPDEWGTYDFRYQLPADAQPGRYCLRVRGWCMGEYYFDVNQEEKKEQEKAVQTGKTEPSPSSILSLHTEKIQYSLGEDIKISLKLAKASSPVLITWEGQSLLGHHAIPCCPEEYSFTLKSSPSLCPEIRVSAYLFQQDSILEASQKISVFDTDKILQIHAQESPEKKGEWKIQILDKQNQPALAKVCLAADMISHRDHPERENIENFYYGSRYIDIPTVDSLDFEFTTDREYSCLQPIAIKLNHNPSSLVQKSLPAFSIGYKNVYWHSCETAENGWITIQMGDSQEKTLRLTIIAIDKKSRVGQKSIFLNY